MPNGSVVHFEIYADDPHGLAKFYTSLFRLEGRDGARCGRSNGADHGHCCRWPLHVGGRARSTARPNSRWRLRVAVRSWPRGFPPGFTSRASVRFGPSRCARVRNVSLCLTPTCSTRPSSRTNSVLRELPTRRKSESLSIRISGRRKGPDPCRDNSPRAIRCDGRDGHLTIDAAVLMFPVPGPDRSPGE